MLRLEADPSWLSEAVQTLRTALQSRAALSSSCAASAGIHFETNGEETPR